jgi:ELWxxDGT repeat protein
MRTLLSLFVFFTCASLIGATAARVVVDVNTSDTPVSSNPQEFAPFGDRLLFAARQLASIGEELWMTDGTREGTELVKDIRIGSAWGEPTYLTEYNGIVLFAAIDGINGNELWISDGTEEGTRMLVDLVPGTLDGDPAELTVYKGRVYFAAEDRVVGQELFVTDGTVEGTVAFTDLEPGTDDADPFQLTLAAGLLFFVADTDAFGEELWVTDGTEAGTRLVKDIRPGSSDGDVEELTPVADGIFFRADDGSTGEELWFSDGTPEGTRLVKDINAGSSDSTPRYMANLNGTLLFRANVPGLGNELWKSDGTAAGTVLVKDINAGARASSPDELTVIGDRVVFEAFTDDEQSEPWVTDGTAAGTFMLKAIGEGAQASSPRDFTRLGNEAIFSIAIPTGPELWKTDGTSEGTVKLADVSITGSSTYAWNGRVFFSGDDGSTGIEPWVTDGTEAGTQLLVNLAPENGNAAPDFLTAVGDDIYFGALEGVEGAKRTRLYALWKSGGTTARSQRMTYFTSQNNPGDLTEMFNLDDARLLFSGRISTDTGFELGISDGTPEGTRILKDIREGPLAGEPQDFLRFNGFGYFFSPPFGDILRTDGTEEGTVVVFDGSAFTGATTALGDFYFQGRLQGAQGGQLWRLGTGVGTATMVADINPGGFAQINEITEYNGALYFSATDQGVNNFERELWTSDGVSGASEVKDIRPGPDGSNPLRLQVANGLLFFAADDGLTGYELWKSDGTEEGTTLVKDIWPGEATSNLSSSDFVAFRDELFFVADDGINGVELWKSDGTAAGTQLVKDIYPGPLSSVVPAEWKPVELDGLLYFAATSPEAGYELWSTDGTEAGTRLTYDLVPGRMSGVPEDLTVNNGSLYFTAYSQAFGRELHVYDPNFVPVPISSMIDGAQLVLEWPLDPERNLQLQKSSGLSVWETVAEPVIQQGATGQVTLPLPTAPQYFRLIEP